MNIAIFSDTYPPEINGVATSTYNLVSILREYGHNVCVVTTNPFSRKSELKDGVLRVPGIEMKKLYGYRMANIYSSNAMRYLKKFKPQVVHIQTDAGVGIFGKIVARRLRLPQVYTYHTMYEDYTYYVTKGRGYFDRVAKRIVKSYSRVIAENATEFISPSVKTKNILRGYGIDGYINVVPTGIDFKKFVPGATSPEKIKEFKQKNNLEDSFIILSLGRVAKEKSIDLCLRGYANFLKTSNIKTKFIVVGGGPELANLKSLVEELRIQDSVLFIGPVPAEEVPFYYHVGDVFVSASITETQGLTFMEAMASETILLARFDENLVNVIRDNDTGYFFNDELDFKDKVTRIIKLEKGQRQKIIENALKTVEEFSIDRFYENIMEVYNRATRKYW